tara:strand:- start:1562 stop:2035 length:474 start_codon:yes stop_codon:yes gene_type:complete
MGLPLALAIASTAFSVMGSMNAAKAAKREAAMRARQLETQKKQAELKAIQEHNIRMANLSTFIGANEALAGTMGRDLGSDRSLKAIIKKAQRETSVDVARANVQLLGEQAQRTLAQRIATEKGNNMARAYRYQAFGTIIKGAYQADRLSSGKDVTSI